MENPNRPLGKNLKHLLAIVVAKKAIPSGGGLAAGMRVIMEGKLGELNREALAEIDVMIAAVKAAPDNPYGDDEETICGAILKSLGRT